MTTVDSTNFQRRFGEMMDRALVEPVKITHRKRAKAVLISSEMYGQLVQAFGIQATRTEDLPDAILSSISSPLTQEEFENGGIQQVSS